MDARILCIRTHPRLESAQGLASLMALYESNFRRLQRLLPERDFPLDRAVSTSVLDEALHLTVQTRERFTQTLHLTYRLRAGDQSIAVPDQRVRVYHDAALAEALLPLGVVEPPVEALQPRLLRNQVLNRWLEQLLNRGHGFALAGRPRFAPDPSESKQFLQA